MPSVNCFHCYLAVRLVLQPGETAEGGHLGSDQLKINGGMHVRTYVYICKKL